MEEGHVEDLLGKVRLALFTFGEDRKVIYTNTAGRRQQDGDGDGDGQVILGLGYLETLKVQLYLIAAAGLGVCFAILSRLRDSVPKATYDEAENFTVFASLVLGVVGGTILAFLAPSGDVAGLGTLTQPILALVGGFSSAVVFRILTRVADAVEGLFAPSPEDQATTAAEKTSLAVRDANISSAQRALQIKALPPAERDAALEQMAQELTDG